MAKSKTSRKQLFRAALAITGTTAGQWAAGEGYSAEHVSRAVNNEKLASAALTEKIDAFIAKHLISHTALAS